MTLKKNSYEKKKSKKNTMYYKGKGRSSSSVYKFNELLVYFIKQNTTFFVVEFFSLE
jgi:hypothetical protein